MARRRTEEDKPVKKDWTENKILLAIKKGGVITLDDGDNCDINDDNHKLIPCGGMWTHICTEDYDWEVVKEPITDPVEYILAWQETKRKQIADEAREDEDNENN